MRVLTFTSLFPNSQNPNHGIFIKERMRAWKEKAGNELVVVAPVPWFPKMSMLSCFKRWYQFSRIPKEEVIEGILVYHPRYLLFPKVGMAFHGFLMGVSVLGPIKRLHRQRSFDLIDAHFIYPDGAAARSISKVLKIPYVASARGSDIHQFSGLRTIRPQIKKVLSSAAHVIAVSQGLKDIMTKDLKISPQSITVVGNGVDTNKFHPIEQKEARQHCHFLPTQIVLLSVGALVPCKNYFAYLTALQQLGEGSVIAVILGEGSERRKLEKFIEDNGLRGKVVLVGSVAHDQLAWWYSAADLFCHSSLREGWANVLMEAMACGLPAVATPAIGASEIIATEDVGLLANGFQAQDISFAINTALHKKWKRDKVRKKAEERDWRCVAGEVQAVFEKALRPWK